MTTNILDSLTKRYEGIGAPSSVKDLQGENIQRQLSMITADPGVQNAVGTIGQIIGSVAIPIPFVGGTIGKTVAKNLVNTVSYVTGFGGEIQKSIEDLKNGSSFGQEVLDVVSYIPKRIITDINNKPLVRIAKGELHPYDAAIKYLEDTALVKFLAPNKTHAWKDDQGRYYRNYQPGTKMVVGTWTTGPNTAPRPDPSSNKISIGKGGEVIRNGF